MNHHCHHCNQSINHFNQCIGTHSFIRTKRHPKEYPDNIDEVTTIDVPAGSRIELMFNTFDLEEDRFTENCRFDFVEIKDGTTTLKLCGKMAVSNFQKATSNEMTVHCSTATPA